MRLFSFEQIDCITTHLQTVLKTQTASELFLKLAPFFAWAIKPRTHPKGGTSNRFLQDCFYTADRRLFYFSPSVTLQHCARNYRPLHAWRACEDSKTPCEPEEARCGSWDSLNESIRSLDTHPGAQERASMSSLAFLLLRARNFSYVW